MKYRWGLLLRFQHVFFFFVFILITFFTENYFLDTPELIWSVLSVIIFNIGIYYLVYYYLVPQFYLSNKYPEFIIYALICFLVSSLFRILLEPTVFNMNFNETLSNTKFLFNVYIAQGIIILVASFLGITKDKFLIEQNVVDLGEQKEQLYLDLLKSKMNPHFLLNTLNNMYANSFVSSAKTSDSILQLSKLLQYIIYDSGREKISLAQEFSSIHSLAKLYQLKYDNQLNIDFDIQNDETLDVVEIPPSIFLTLFENALKHSGIGLEPGSFIKVLYSIKERDIFFEIINSINTKRPVEDTGYNGLGNEAINQILEKYYSGKYDFSSNLIENDEYKTTLKINLNG
ncbi:histidine kinase [Chryseobacterium sp. T16E-39]|uniref:sensor histidine kinase n=1 Tax=Chryseobacterium sp. T16E-39 TaxID=2015076 RepID=UPI000B5B3C98|nr:histidine kinase [Chryseobacterium sp. T16E-39]ASK32750.1 histidine kinase [Chryseobacterium sp. T16E-39]